MQSISYVEIVGLPGAGKTEAAKRLISYAKTHRSSLLNRSPLNLSLAKKIVLLGKVGLFLLTHPRFLSLFFLSIRNEYARLPNVRGVVLNLVVRFIAEVAIISSLQKNTKDVIINDEGMVGRLVALATLTSLGSDRIGELLRIVLPSRTQVLFIDVDPHVAIEREQSRTIDLPFFNAMDDSTKKVFFSTSASVYRAVLDELREKKIAHGSTILNNGNIEQLTTEITQCVDALCR